MSSSQSPRDVADLLRRDRGDEGAETELQRRIADADTKTEQNRALAALGELRKLRAETTHADGDACSALGCRATSRLRRVDGQVLCEYCAIEKRQR